MDSNNSDIKSLAIQSVGETIQSAIDRGIDLADTEIVISFDKTNWGFDRVRTRLVQNVFTLMNYQKARTIESPKNESPTTSSQDHLNVESPKWNGRELFYYGRIVKRYRNPGPNQQTVLSAFEEEGWPERIDNPLCSTLSIDAGSRLADTIKSLNRNHKCYLISFHGDGSGQGVIWRRVCNNLE